MAKKGSYLVFAHFLCRSLSAVCLSTIPAANVLLVFAGLESPLLLLSWHLSTALGVAWARQVTLLGQDICPSMCCFSSACTVLESADSAKAQSVMQSGS